MRATTSSICVDADVERSAARLAGSAVAAAPRLSRIFAPASSSTSMALSGSR